MNIYKRRGVESVYEQGVFVRNIYEPWRGYWGCVRVPVWFVDLYHRAYARIMFR
jgi:hypothetical protein